LTRSSLPLSESRTSSARTLPSPLVAPPATGRRSSIRSRDAGLAFHTDSPRIRWRILCFAAMRARHELRGAVFRTERIEEGKRGDRIGEFAVGSVAMQFLRAAARTRFTPLDLRQEDAFRRI
jgi:hypothetical protein